MNLIAHVEIPAADLQRAMRFYSRVFDIVFDDVVDLHDSKMAYFPFEEGQDGASGTLAQGPVYVPTLHGPIVYFGVADIDDTLRKAQALGSEILFPKTLTDTGCYVAEICDSEGTALRCKLPPDAKATQRGDLALIAKAAD
ncbi:MAG: VOC family protein [Pseudomonadales bacterium]